MRIVFVHLDMGIGGAERLVVDAAMGLQSRGHEVSIFTTHHDPSHAFPETVDGTLHIHCAGDWLPRSLFGSFTLCCAILRMYYICVYLSLSSSPDCILLDQVSYCVPLLRGLFPAPVLFYCHYPDQLLSDTSHWYKRVYRVPLDYLEGITTRMADCVLVNSRYTLSVFVRVFGRTRVLPEVLYPCMDVHGCMEQDSAAAERGVGNIFVSLNRFEKKKNIELAIRAFGRMRNNRSSKLVVGGGYDERVVENIEYAQELVQLCARLGMSTSVFPDMDGEVVFGYSLSSEAKLWLFRTCVGVLYTPSNEHFGIVPLEAMLYRAPVIAVGNGGPLESVVHGETGFLCIPEDDCEEQFASYMDRLVEEPQLVERMGAKGHERVLGEFSRDAFSCKLERIIECMVQKKKRV